MRRRDLDKLRRLDPKVAAQLEGVLERRQAVAKGPGEGGGEPTSDRRVDAPNALPSPASNETPSSFEANSIRADWPDAGADDETELQRRKAERAAERQAQREQDRAYSARLGFFPGASFRRRGTGDAVSCDLLEAQLDGIERRVGRATTWDEGLSAVRTMEHVEAQCFNVRDLGDRPDSMPGCVRGLFPELTPSQRILLRAVVSAYMGGALGVYEYQPILASDLGISERALRYALNGGRGRPPGLIELGLVQKRQTWKRGAGERPSDHHYLLLQVGAVLGKLLLPVVCERRAARGERLPRRTGYTRRSARQASTQVRQQARRVRCKHAERRLVRARDSSRNERSKPVQSRREGGRKKGSNQSNNCAAQIADNPVPPPTGVGGLGSERGKPPSTPLTNASLRDKPMARPSSSLSPRIGSDSPPLSKAPGGDGTRALDAGASSGPVPDPLELWRRRRTRGVPVPEAIEEQLFSQLISTAYSAMFGVSEPPSNE